MRFIKEAANEIEIKKGFRQISIKENRFEILVNRVQQGVILDKHVHAFSQFGYCFKGVFAFTIENKTYTMKENDNYDMKGNLEHGADFITDIIALDLKYIEAPRSECSIIMNGLSKQEAIYTFENETIKLRVLKTKELNSLYEIVCEANEYLVMDQDISLFNNEKNMILDKHKIYQAIHTEKVFISQSGVLILIKIK